MLVDSQTEDELENQYIFSRYKSKLTLNNYGKMSLTETPHFTLLKNIANKSKPVLDIGCAYGFTSLALLENGFEVIANDLNNEHLVDGFKDISNEQRARLTLKVCNLLDLNFEENSLSGIVALNVLHFLVGSDIREMFRRFYKWLAPNGVLTVSVGTPYFGDILFSNDLRKTYSETFYNKLNSGIEWPGENAITFAEINLSDTKKHKLIKNMPKNLNWLSTEILAREAIHSHFNIFKLEYFNENDAGYSELKDNTNKLFASIICVKDTL
jgi:SAM-dependent methyltransferase